MAKDEEILESLIQDGLIGTALGALLTNKNKSAEGAMLSVILGAALLGTFKANERAKKSNVQLWEEEGDTIYEIDSSGKRIVKKVSKPAKEIPRQFKLK